MLTFRFFIHFSVCYVSMGAKKKRQRKNKKWIPYKELTPEEREELRRDSDKKRFRKQLMENKLRVAAAISSGNHYELSHAPRPTNEVLVFHILIMYRIMCSMMLKQEGKRNGMFKDKKKTMNPLMITRVYVI